MEAVARALFFAAVAALLWTAVLFPVVVGIWGAILRRRVRRGDITPSVSVIVAAHNEAGTIARKIRNTLDSDYPADRLEVVVASDGSTDDTATIAAAAGAGTVRVLDLPRRGKVHALNEAVQAARGEILLFTDANTMLERGALRRLVGNFADPDVGGVCGNQAVRPEGDEDSSADGEHLYWSYDKRLKALESATGSIVSADGALYAIRRELYRRPSSAVLNDDFAISTKVVEQGKRLVFDAEALAWEPPSASAGHEFERKVRIVSRGLWSVLDARVLLDPTRYGFYSLVLFTHKVLRRLTPLFLAAAFAGSIMLAGSGPFFALVAALQIAFYAVAAAGGLVRSTRLGRSRLFGAPFFFCLANAAALVGLGHVLRGKKIEVWQPRRRDAVA